MRKQRKPHIVVAGRDGRVLLLHHVRRYIDRYDRVGGRDNPVAAAWIIGPPTRLEKKKRANKEGVSVVAKKGARPMPRASVTAVSPMDYCRHTYFVSEASVYKTERRGGSEPQARACVLP